ncbi:MAG: FkbM family methyltransferase [Lutibacter sp.]|nr:FkbM family methyltransferase [Lutibacter sp.]
MTLINKIKYKLKQWYLAYFLKDADALLALEWIKNDRKFDYRHRYSLPTNAVIFDFGGYKGDWTASMLKLHPHSTVHVFEVVPEYVAILERRFGSDKRVKIYNFGLGKDNSILKFTIEDLASSTFRLDKISNEKIIEASIYDASEFMDKHNFQNINLCKMNIEGGEFDLLSRLVEVGYISRFENIQIQFHNYGEWSIQYRDKLRTQLAKTHNSTYDYAWIFENWRRNE